MIHEADKAKRLHEAETGFYFRTRRQSKWKVINTFVVEKAESPPGISPGKSMVLILYLILYLHTQRSPQLHYHAHAQPHNAHATNYK